MRGIGTRIDLLWNSIGVVSGIKFGISDVIFLAVIAVTNTGRATRCIRNTLVESLRELLSALPVDYFTYKWLSILSAHQSFFIVYYHYFHYK